MRNNMAVLVAVMEAAKVEDPAALLPRIQALQQKEDEVRRTDEEVRKAKEELLLL